MNLTTLMQIGASIDESSTYGERALVGLQVVGIGMGVVFGVLLILIGILQLFKLFGNKKPEETSVKASVPVSAPTLQVNTAPASEEEKIVAIATAAIAAARGESECAFKVISIKKIVK